MTKDDKLYGVQDQERLCSTPEQVVEDAIECGDVDRPNPWPIRICVFRRMKIPSAEHVAALALDQVLETIDEEFGDPDGDSVKPTAAMQAAALSLGRAVVVDYIPWACERTGEVIEYTREMRERRAAQ